MHVKYFKQHLAHNYVSINYYSHHHFTDAVQRGVWLVPLIATK